MGEVQESSARPWAGWQVDKAGGTEGEGCSGGGGHMQVHICPSSSHP